MSPYIPDTLQDSPGPYQRGQEGEMPGMEERETSGLSTALHPPLGSPRALPPAGVLPPPHPWGSESPARGRGEERSQGKPTHSLALPSLVQCFLSRPPRASSSPWKPRQYPEFPAAAGLRLLLVVLSPPAAPQPCNPATQYWAFSKVSSPPLFLHFLCLCLSASTLTCVCL